MAKKFRFPLEKVKKHREQVEQLAQKDFQLGLAALNQEIEALERMEEQTKEALKSRLDKTSVPALTQVHDFLMGQDIRIDRQKKKIQEYEKRVESLREILRQKAIETKIIKELEQRKLREFQEEARKKELLNQDDLNLMRYRLKDDVENKK